MQNHKNKSQFSRAIDYYAPAGWPTWACSEGNFDHICNFDICHEIQLTNAKSLIFVMKYNWQMQNHGNKSWIDLRAGPLEHVVRASSLVVGAGQAERARFRFIWSVIFVFDSELFWFLPRSAKWLLADHWPSRLVIHVWNQDFILDSKTCVNFLELEMRTSCLINSCTVERKWRIRLMIWRIVQSNNPTDGREKQFDDPTGWRLTKVARAWSQLLGRHVSPLLEKSCQQRQGNPKNSISWLNQPWTWSWQ